VRPGAGNGLLLGIGASEKAMSRLPVTGNWGSGAKATSSGTRTTGEGNGNV